MVKAVVLAVPGELATATGGYVYDRRMLSELEALDWRVDVVGLGEGFPHPTPPVHATACARLVGLPRGPAIVVDGLAFGVLPQAGQMLRDTHALVALVHHPLALESGLSPARAAELRASERSALAAARHVIATSEATARLLAADYGVAADRLSVVKPGTDRVVPRRVPPLPHDEARPKERPAVLLAVGAVVPRKGYDLLVAAVARLRDLPWRLVIAGDRGRSPRTAQRLAEEIARLKLADRVSLRGAVTADELAELYLTADLFVLPSRFEGYGMAYAEAIAHGLPVVGTRAGAIPETVPRTAGLLVPPEDVPALTAALRHLLEDAPARARLAAGARAAVFPTWREQAMLFARVLERLG